MINYNKNKLINETLDKYYETFAHTLDTCDYVPEKYNDKVLRYIFKNLKKTFRKIDREECNFETKNAEKRSKKRKIARKHNKKEAKTWLFSQKSTKQWLKNAHFKNLWLDTIIARLVSKEPHLMAAQNNLIKL